nr:MAG TPA: hypothetical protein [Caudoviricetes sp.]
MKEFGSLGIRTIRAGAILILAIKLYSINLINLHVVWNVSMVLNDLKRMNEKRLLKWREQNRLSKND